VPAAAVVLLARLIEPSGRSLGEALVELFVFAAITVVATWALERRLLGEMAGYLRRSRAEAQGLGDTGAPANTGEPLPRAGVASEGGA
jgi:hypothetical protein